MSKNFHPVGNTYALDVTAVSQNIAITIPTSEAAWDTMDYLFVNSGTKDVYVSTAAPAVIPTTGLNTAGVMIPAGAVMILGYPGTVTFSCIASGTGSTLYVTQGRGE